MQFADSLLFSLSLSLSPFSLCVSGLLLLFSPLTVPLQTDSLIESRDRNGKTHTAPS